MVTSQYFNIKISPSASNRRSGLFNYTKDKFDIIITACFRGQNEYYARTKKA